MIERGRPYRVWYQTFCDPELDAPYIDRLTGVLEGVLGPECEVCLRGHAPGDPRPDGPVGEGWAVRTVAAAHEAEADDFDGFVIGHFLEPGLLQARAAVDLPVVGLGESSLLFACTLGRAVGLVASEPELVPHHEALLREHGLDKRVVAVRAIDAHPDDFDRAFGETHLYEQLKADFVRQARTLVAEGVDVIVPAGGYAMLLFSREQNFRVDGATVMNGLPVVMRWIETAMDLHARDGTRASRILRAHRMAPEERPSSRPVL